MTNQNIYSYHVGITAPAQVLDEVIREVEQRRTALTPPE